MCWLFFNYIGVKLRDTLTIWFCRFLRNCNGIVTVRVVLFWFFGDGNLQFFFNRLCETFISTSHVSDVYLGTYLFIPENILKVLDKDISYHNRFACVYKISHTWLLTTHKTWAEAYGQVISCHFATAFMRKYVFPKEFKEKSQSNKVKGRQTPDKVLDVLSFIGNSLIMEQSFIRFEKNDRFLQVTKETFNQACNQERIFDFLKIIIIALAELSQSLVFLIYRNTLSKNSFFF